MIIHDILSNCNTKLQIDCKFILYNAAARKKYDLNWSPLSGRGTQHPHRALGGTCVLLAAVPTTPPCFRRRGFYCCANADFPDSLFHRGEPSQSSRFARCQLPRRGSWHAAGVTEKVLPASTSLSSTIPSHENGVQKHPRAFLDPKIKNIISLAYAQSNAERIQNRPT